MGVSAGSGLEKVLVVQGLGPVQMGGEGDIIKAESGRERCSNRLIREGRGRIQFGKEGKKLSILRSNRRNGTVADSGHEWDVTDWGVQKIKT